MEISSSNQRTTQVSEGVYAKINVFTHCSLLLLVEHY